MKKVVIFVVVVVAAVLVMKSIMEKAGSAGGSDSARRRVHDVLENIKTGQEQNAICMWAQGKQVLSEDEFRIYVDRYADFVSAKKVDKISIYSVDEVKESGPDRFRVAVTIDGRKLAMLVPKANPILWVD